jgi:hypothetical protein
VSTNFNEGRNKIKQALKFLKLRSRAWHVYPLIAGTGLAVNFRKWYAAPDMLLCNQRIRDQSLYHSTPVYVRSRMHQGCTSVGLSRETVRRLLDGELNALKVCKEIIRCAD